MQNRLSEQRGLRQVRGCFRNYLLGGCCWCCCTRPGTGALRPGSPAGAAWVWGDGFVMSGILLYLAVGASALGRHGYFDWVFTGLICPSFCSPTARMRSTPTFSTLKSCAGRGTAPFWPGVLVATIWFLIGLILSMLYYLL